METLSAVEHRLSVTPADPARPMTGGEARRFLNPAQSSPADVPVCDRC